MPRYKLIVEYDGGPFVGWQRQPNGPTVQALLEEAIFAMSGERVAVQGAGRTDSGVHALGQVAHFDLLSEMAPDKVQAALNFHLKPNPIALPSVEIAPAKFHARFTATWRRYRYRILNRRAPPTLDRGHVWHVPARLDLAAMIDAAAVLQGHHDFNSFRSTACQAPSSIKTLDLLRVTSALGRSCTIKCAFSLEPSGWWGVVSGRGATSWRRWPPAIAHGPARRRRRKACA